MLKTCWDCISGFNADRERAGNDAAYGVRLNGDTQRAPPWPQPRLQNEIMFLLPRALNEGDQIEVSGTMTGNPRTFTVNLITGYNGPDYENIACQLEAKFPSSNDDKIALRIINNGYPEEIDGDYQSIRATEWFTDTNFNFGFVINVNRNNGAHKLDISIGPSYLEEVNLKHSIDSIRYLSLSGDVAKVDKLDFKFA